MYLILTACLKITWQYFAALSVTLFGC